jgi:hypothetical protein
MKASAPPKFHTFIIPVPSSQKNRAENSKPKGHFIGPSAQLPGVPWPRDESYDELSMWTAIPSGCNGFGARAAASTEAFAASAMVFSCPLIRGVRRPRDFMRSDSKANGSECNLRYNPEIKMAVTVTAGHLRSGCPNRRWPTSVRAIGKIGSSTPMRAPASAARVPRGRSGCRHIGRDCRG